MNKTSWLMTIAAFLVGLALASGIAWIRWPDEAAVVERQVSLEIRLRFGDQTASFNEGSGCTIAQDRREQVVITNASDSIVALFSPERGEIDQDSDGTWYCTGRFDVTVQDSIAYTIIINREPQYVISRNELDSLDNQLVITWPTGGQGTPEATPIIPPFAATGTHT